MRTTVTIDDALYRKAKTAAARSGRTVGEVIEDALHQALGARRDAATALEPLPTFGGTGVMPGIDLGSNAALEDVMGDDRVDALR